MQEAIGKIALKLLCGNRLCAAIEIAHIISLEFCNLRACARDRGSCEILGDRGKPIDPRSGKLVSFRNSRAVSF